MPPLCCVSRRCLRPPGRSAHLRRLISFDIDGTLEVGDPPGIVTLQVVRRALDLGMVVGSCSDRPLSFQQRLWETHGVDVHFTALKQELLEVRTRFEVDHYLHIGDTPIDRMMAEGAGFDFLHVDDDDVRAYLREHGLHE
jgi:phosphoglycolate phosphatase-like HAD superfamily hydrolase